MVAKRNKPPVSGEVRRCIPISSNGYSTWKCWHNGKWYHFRDKQALVTMQVAWAAQLNLEV
jgi:hypothetical protein